MVKAVKQLIAGLAVLLLTMTLPLSCFAMDDFPEEVEIGSLANLYEPVTFDHAMHVEMTPDCSVCHHHTTGTGTQNSYCAKCHADAGEGDTVACQDCHSADPMSAENLHKTPESYNFHDDKPGLKAVYHLNCLGCHKEVGAPTGCEDCHAKTEAGEKFYHSGEFAPKGDPGHGEHH